MNIQTDRPPPAPGPVAERAAPRARAGDVREVAVPPPVPTQTQAAAPVQVPLSIDAVKQIAHQINDFLKSSSSSLQFTVDGDTSKVVVRIVDSQTNELIRQIPSEEMLAISRAMDKLKGMLISRKA